MKKIFENNIFLKIFSFIIALIIWAYVVIIIDPSITVTIRDIPVDFSNEERLTKSGLSVIGQKENKVEVKIKGSRKILSDLNSKNIVAVLNLSQANEFGKYKIPITVTLPIDNVSIVKKKPYYVDVHVDKVAEKRFNIKLNTIGVIKEGFIHYDTKITPSSVLVSGSEKVVNQISDASITLNYNEACDDINLTYKVILLDKDGSELRSPLVIKDINDINVCCKIGALKTVDIFPRFIKISGEQVNANTENYKIFPNSITIYGKQDVIKNIEKLYTELIIINKNDETFEKKIKLEIPDEINIREDIKEVNIKYNKNKFK
ncbi:MAG: hypothetical protein LBJ09_03015 [Clostridiales bacterium]|jgi:YbbR domain-containing protein|nr:hypothetical protein [Clostridiales bacterium]